MARRGKRRQRRQRLGQQEDTPKIPGEESWTSVYSTWMNGRNLQATVRMTRVNLMIISNGTALYGINAKFEEIIGVDFIDPINILNMGAIALMAMIANIIWFPAIIRNSEGIFLYETGMRALEVKYGGKIGIFHFNSAQFQEYRRRNDDAVWIFFYRWSMVGWTSVAISSGIKLIVMTIGAR